jgi:hypothetical protein
LTCQAARGLRGKAVHADLQANAMRLATSEPQPQEGEQAWGEMMIGCENYFMLSGDPERTSECSMQRKHRETEGMEGILRSQLVWKEPNR